MSPRVIPEACKNVSNTEKRVFRELEKRLPEDWLVLHSLWMRTHNRKTHAESDFIVISEKAIILLEVKGGIVNRDTNGWHIETIDGRSEGYLNESPFEQAKGAYYAIKNYLEKIGKIEIFYDYVWGYGVIMPDCTLKIPVDPLIDKEMLLDETGYPEKISDFIDQLGEYWKKDCIRRKKGTGFSQDSLNTFISSSKMKSIFNLLRPEFEAVVGLGHEARQVEIAQIELTEKQYKALDYAAEHKRILLKGAAGTGKTVLAFEQALRKSLEGKRVLFVCFNRYLADFLKRKGQEVHEMKSVDIYNYHRLLMKVLREAKMSTVVPDDWNEFNRTAPDLVLEALSKYEQFEQYDYLIMDEGQDLMRSEFISVLDLLIKGGLKNGCWTICYDHSQTIFMDQYENETYEYIMSIDNSSISLSENCRNTKQIAGGIRELTDAGVMPVVGKGGIEGPEIIIEYFKNHSEFRQLLRKGVNNLIDELEVVKIPASEIIILTGMNDYIGNEVGKEGFFKYRAIDVSGPVCDKCVRTSTVQAFKGLEATAVFLIGIETFNREAKKLMYVGGSRARSILHLILPVECLPDVVERMSNIKIFTD